jgi:ribosome biogenesis GTPase
VEQREIEDLSGLPFGLVMANFGQKCSVRPVGGVDRDEVFTATIRRPAEPLHVVAGDYVRFEFTAPREQEAGEEEEGSKAQKTEEGDEESVVGQARVASVAPRDNELQRSDKLGFGKAEVMAANVDTVFVVLSPFPVINLMLVNRYLQSIEVMGAQAVLVYNKVDMLSQQYETEQGDTEAMVTRKHIAFDQESLDLYASIGYKVLRTSSFSGEGMEELKSLINAPLPVSGSKAMQIDPARQRTSLLLGDSGTGKSSLVNFLLPELDLYAKDLSRRGSGRHSTTNTKLYDVPGGGIVLDSPGLANFTPPAADLLDVAFGYREIYEIGKKCKYANCMHGPVDSTCAVRVAVEKGQVDRTRYHTYLREVKMAQEAEFKRRTTPLRKLKNPPREQGNR